MGGVSWATREIVMKNRESTGASRQVGPVTRGTNPSPTGSNGIKEKGKRMKEHEALGKEWTKKSIFTTSLFQLSLNN